MVGLHPLVMTKDPCIENQIISGNFRTANMRQIEPWGQWGRKVQIPGTGSHINSEKVCEQLGNRGKTLEAISEPL